MPASSRKRRSPLTPAAWGRIQLFAMDVDGVLTDGTVQISSDGTESKGFSILDGLGLKRLVQAGFDVAWISGRPSGATAARARELEIPHLVQGRTDKLNALRELAQKLHLTAAQCAYMGDDEIDAPAIQWAGIGIGVAGGMPGALAAASIVPGRRPGHGAVREICDHLLAARAAARRR